MCIRGLEEVKKTSPTLCTFYVCDIQYSDPEGPWIHNLQGSIPSYKDRLTDLTNLIGVAFWVPTLPISNKRATPRTLITLTGQGVRGIIWEGHISFRLPLAPYVEDLKISRRYKSMLREFLNRHQISQLSHGITTSTSNLPHADDISLPTLSCPSYAIKSSHRGLFQNSNRYQSALVNS